jgi:hypothetical protein
VRSGGRRTRTRPHHPGQQSADDEGWAVIDRLSMHYDGRPYPDHAHRHAFARVRVTDWNSFGV